MTEKFEVVVNSSIGSNIVGKELKKAVNECYKALRTIERSKWQWAKALHEIDANDYWRTDYKDLETFFKDFGVSKATYYRVLAACSMLESVIIPNGYNEDQFPITKASLLAVLGNAVQNFIDQCKEKEIHIELMSKNELEKEIKKYRKSLDNAIDGNGEGENEEKEKKEAKPKAEIDGKDIVIKYDGKTYRMPLKELKKYEVKEEKE